jgi:2,3-bisphosphoglycerate-dependent phosphoglycerate mutase
MRPIGLISPILVLVRHGESVWNARNLWTGWQDIPLSEKGRRQSLAAAKKLTGIRWDYLFESDLTRTKQTSDVILDYLRSLSDLKNLIRVADPALRERNYGIYTGRNKKEVEKEMGEKRFLQIRRGWDVPIPKGESLKQVYARVVPYFQKEIAPKLQAGKNIIISAHGNSLRALVKYLNKISDADIAKLEIPLGGTCFYRVSPVAGHTGTSIGSLQYFEITK